MGLNTYYIPVATKGERLHGKSQFREKLARALGFGANNAHGGFNINPIEIRDLQILLRLSDDEVERADLQQLISALEHGPVKVYADD